MDCRWLLGTVEVGTVEQERLGNVGEGEGEGEGEGV